jgi:hypothetical protein
MRSRPSQLKYLGTLKKTRVFINPTVYTQTASEIHFVKLREKITNRIVGFPAILVKIEGFLFSRKKEVTSSYCYVLGKINYGGDKTYIYTPVLFLNAFIQLLINMLMLEVLFVWGTIGFFAALHTYQL